MKINISNFMIGLVVVGFILFGVFGFIQSLNNVNTISGYETSDLKNNINFTKNITTDVATTKEDILDTSATPSLFDIAGFFANSVWGSIKGVFNSFIVFDEFVTHSTKDLSGNVGGIIEFRNMILLILTIMIFIGFATYLLLGRSA